MSSSSSTQISTTSCLERLGLAAAKTRVVVVGLGKTGLSVAKFLNARGIAFAVVDSRERPPGLAELRESCPDAAVFLGGFERPAMAVATHLIVSPGVALDEPSVQSALAGGARLLSDIDLFACMVQAPVVGITGANGKSTVTSLLGVMAQKSGKKAQVGGNLGTPALDLLDEAAELYVLELSSFQLERTEWLPLAAATVLNVSPDHMDRYRDVAEYAAVKQRIFRHAGVRVLNADDALVARMTEPGRACVFYGLDSRGPQPDPTQEPVGSLSPRESRREAVSLRLLDYSLIEQDGQEWLAMRGEPLLRAGEVLLKGRHNLSNALAALALGDAIGLPREGMQEALRSFRGLDHRMQFVAEIDGVVWINDSKATNIGACMAALEGLSGHAVLIAGGDGKGADFAPLAGLADKLRGVVLMGKDADKLETVLKPVTETVRAANMRSAVSAARQLAWRGDCVLLSPACASLDQYTDYQHRGRVFAEAVKALRT
ncbi:MAG: UDP-N-acetylmuramoyl-L-alanine--D-glutamate ligase [Methylococcaceae bacterium]|nr:MAG: UDP-N-acetylmuramoyl-L-alanine--D-glutamate ligase [Methylococcaceae bacterium]